MLVTVAVQEINELYDNLALLAVVYAQDVADNSTANTTVQSDGYDPSDQYVPSLHSVSAVCSFSSQLVLV